MIKFIKEVFQIWWLQQFKCKHQNGTYKSTDGSYDCKRCKDCTKILRTNNPGIGILPPREEHSCPNCGHTFTSTRKRSYGCGVG